MELLKALKKIKKVCEKQTCCENCPLRAVTYGHCDCSCSLRNNDPRNWDLIEVVDNRLFKE